MAVEAVVPGALTTEERDRVEQHGVGHLLDMASPIPEIERNLKLKLDRHKYFLDHDKLKEMKIDKGKDHPDTGKPFEFKEISEFKTRRDIAEYISQRNMRRLVFSPLPTECWSNGNIHDGMMSKHMFDPSKVFGAKTALLKYLTDCLKNPRKNTQVMQKFPFPIGAEDIIEDVVFIMLLPGTGNVPFTGSLYTVPFFV